MVWFRENLEFFFWNFFGKKVSVNLNKNKLVRVENVCNYVVFLILYLIGWKGGLSFFD